jgi:5-formyltetrahydrofolate cyclo-ligase
MPSGNMGNKQFYFPFMQRKKEQFRALKPHSEETVFRIQAPSFIED